MTHDERLIPLTTLFVGHYLPAEVVMHLQYVQKRPGYVTVRIEKRRGGADADTILRGLRRMVREGITFELEFVDRLEKTHRGKHMICRQYLDIEAIKKRKENIIAQTLGAKTKTSTSSEAGRSPLFY